MDSPEIGVMYFFNWPSLMLVRLRALTRTAFLQTLLIPLKS